MADPTQEQLKAAARRALDAGDVAAAEEIFRYAKSLSGGGSTRTIATTDDGGRVYEMADGKRGFSSPGYSTTNPEQVAKILEGAKPVDLVRDSIDQQWISENLVASRGNEVIRGVPLVGSYMDEMVGLISPKAGEGMRRASEAMERQKPGQSTALNIVGGVLGAIPMAMAAGPAIAARMPTSRMGQAATGLLGGASAGAVEGTIYGAGEGTTAGERTGNAQRQGLLGAAFGGALGAVAPVVSEALQAGLKKLKTSDISQIMQRFSLSRPAAKVLKEHIDADRLDDAVAMLRRSGDDAMLGEATPGARALLDATAARGGAAANTVNDAIEGRVSAANAQFRSAADDVLGPAPRGLLTAADEIAERTRPARSAAYDAAFNTPIDYASEAGRQVEDVLSRTPPRTIMAAIQDANEDMLARGLPRNMQIMADIADDGTVTFREMPNVKQLDELKKALQRVARTNVDTFGRLDGKGQRYDMLAGQLRDAVGDAAVDPNGGKPYLDAVRIGGDKIREEEALKMGSTILSAGTSRDDALRMMAGASADEKAAARAGLRLAIDEKMATVRRVASDPNVEARQVSAAINDLSSEAVRTKVKAILGPADAKKLFDEVDRLAQGFNLRASVSENSRTARRQAVNADIDAATQRNPLQTISAGQPVEGTRRVVQLLTGETDDALAFRRDGVAQEIAQFLTTQKGKSAEAALRYVNQAISGQRLTNAQAKFVADQLAATGYLSTQEQGRSAIDPYIPSLRQ